MSANSSVKRRQGHATYHNVIAAEQVRNGPPHRKSRGRRLELAGEYVEPEYVEDRYETERDRLVAELVASGLGTKQALSVSGRMLELSK